MHTLEYSIVPMDAHFLAVLNTIILTTLRPERQNKSYNSDTTVTAITYHPSRTQQHTSRQFIMCQLVFIHYTCGHEIWDPYSIEPCRFAPEIQLNEQDAIHPRCIYTMLCLLVHPTQRPCIVPMFVNCPGCRQERYSKLVCGRESLGEW